MVGPRCRHARGHGRTAHDAPRGSPGVSRGRRLAVAAVFVRRTESRLTLLHLILVAVFAMLNAVAGVYLVGPSWTICPGEPEMVAAIPVAQGFPEFEACRAGGPLAGYPVEVVTLIVMSPSLLLAAVEARSATKRVQ